EEGGGRDAAAAAALQVGAALEIGAVVLRQQRAGEVDLAAAKMAMQVDGARHDDPAGEVVGLIDLRTPTGVGGDAPVAQVEIADAIAVVGRVDDATASELHERHAAPPASARSIRPSTSAALGRPLSRSFASGRATTPSVRKIC